MDVPLIDICSDSRELSSMIDTLNNKRILPRINWAQFLCVYCLYARVGSVLYIIRMCVCGVYVAHVLMIYFLGDMREIFYILPAYIQYI